MELKALPLTQENFKDYGYVLDSTQEPPMADNAEFRYWGKVTKLKMGEVVSTGVLFGHMREPVVKSLERHLKTPEVMVAYEGDSLICVAKPMANSDKIEDVRVFVIKQGQAFAMHAGTWHWVPFPTNDKMCKFLVMFASETEANDMDVRNLPEEIRIFA